MQPALGAHYWVKEKKLNKQHERAELQMWLFNWYLQNN